MTRFYGITRNALDLIRADQIKADAKARGETAREKPVRKPKRRRGLRAETP